MVRLFCTDRRHLHLVVLVIRVESHRGVVGACKENPTQGRKRGRRRGCQETAQHANVCGHSFQVLVRK